MTGISARRVAALIAIPVLLIACAVFATATIERNSALRAGTQEEAGQRLLTAMLDQETGARGYLVTRQERFLAPWYRGQAELAAALAESRSLSTGDAPLLQALDEQAQLSRMWHAAVAAEIARLRATGRRPSTEAAVFQKSNMDDFRQLNSLFLTQLAMRRDRALSNTTWLAVAVAVALSIVLAITGMLLLRWTTRHESRRLKRQQELRELLQVSDSEEESQLLLIRHVERIVPGSAAAVFNRHNSDDRLEPRLSEAAAQTPLSDLDTEALKPRSCMAVRLSRSYVQRPDAQPLLRCEACGKIAADLVCEPLLVGGQVIGSVLVTRERTIGPAELALVRDSVVQAAPILANQRNLGLAEHRAASDALTGLPNRRAADETIKRMVANAGRTVTPMSVVLIDLDHFEQVNNLYGHEQGDTALATVGQTLAASVRASDFAARYGGEEFVLLLPDTDRGGAVEVAEKLRRSIERAEIRGIGALTASFGIAALPADAVEPEDLLRRADRALYSAKAHGRNRVEVAVPSGTEVLGGEEPHQ
jgi:diguanylate cyclase (GGDEF)-like protein